MAFRDCDINEAGILDVQSVSDMISAFKAPAADAVKLIRKDNPFPTACALICEHPCEARCRRNMIDSAINIRGLKRMAVDNARANTVPVPEKAEHR